MARKNYTSASLRPYSRGILGFGDSRTNGVGSTDGNGYYIYLSSVTDNRRIRYQGVPRIAQNGWTAALWTGGSFKTIDSELAAATETPDYILVNLGVNDTGANADQLDSSQWQSDYAYILDAFHAKWPDALVYCARVWSRFDNGQRTLLNDTWIPAVLLSRSWAFLGIDERDFLENGDNGTTYTMDGIHPNDAGYRLIWQKWLDVI